MAERIGVSLEGKQAYEIVIDTSFQGLGEELVKAGCKGRKCCIVTEDHVSAFYLTQVYDLVREVCGQAFMFAFTAGEASKTLDTVRDLYEALIRQQFDRHDFLIALGGGVTGDLTGFAAATYLRGIRFIQLPTSLLAQVDSSIGGKTGVDFKSYKNMVGAFHMPVLVYTNITTLQTLNDREFASGMGEVIKHGLIADPAYYQMLLDRREEIMKRRPEALTQVVKGSDLIKRHTVEQDPTEQGIRKTLNFGHTLGHAIEKESGFRLSHGASVGLGMLCAAHISKARGYLTDHDLEVLTALMRAYGLPVTMPALDPGLILADTKNDKKMDQGKIQFILLKKIGEAVIASDVTEDEMRKALAKIDEQ